MKKARDRFIKNLRYFCLIGVIALGLMTIVATGGGGGGGGSAPSENATEKTFRLEDPNTYEPGYKISFSLSGSSTVGDNFEGSFTVNTRDKTTIDEQIVTPIESLLNLTNTNTGAFVSSLGTAYYNDNKEPVEMIIDDKIYTPITISIFPETAEIGDFGSITSWSCSDGSTSTGTWILEEATGGLANLVTMSTDKDSLGNIEYYEEMTITIDEEGDPKSIAMRIYYPDSDITVNLLGSRTV